MVDRKQLSNGDGYLSESETTRVRFLLARYVISSRVVSNPSFKSILFCSLLGFSGLRADIDTLNNLVDFVRL